MDQTIVPITPERHGGKVWNRRSGYAHAATQTAAVMCNNELALAVRTLPMCFVLIDGEPTLVALLCLIPGQNLFVAPDGRWIGGYVPKALRTYPFRLAPTGETDRFALLIDEASGLIGDEAAGGGGTPFFNADGEAAEDTRKVLDFLFDVHRGQLICRHAATVLADKDLIEPWPLTAEHDGAVKNIAGISRVAEARLAELTGQDLVELRDCGALAMAYMQLASMANLRQIKALARAHRKFAEDRSQRMQIPAGSFIDEADDEMKIDWDAVLGKD